MSNSTWLVDSDEESMTLAAVFGALRMVWLVAICLRERAVMNSWSGGAEVVPLLPERFDLFSLFIIK